MLLGLIFRAGPLRVYVIAQRYGWYGEAKFASIHTLYLSLFDAKYESQLHKLSVKDLLALIKLHRRRRDEYKQYLDGMAFSRSNDILVSQCPSGEKLDYSSWRELKVRIFQEMDERPSGEALQSFEREQWPETVAIWNARCKKCEKPQYLLLTTQNIVDEINKLPLSAK